MMPMKGKVIAYHEGESLMETVKEKKVESGCGAVLLIGRHLHLRWKEIGPDRFIGLPI